MMKTIRRSLGAAAAVLALAASLAGAAAPVPLATIDADTLTTDELLIELGVMLGQAPGHVRFEAPDPERVLRRMIQNELVIQEGYRMGLDRGFAVRNPRSEALRTRCVRALLDSVAATVPQGDLDDAGWLNARRTRVEAYLDELHVRHDASVDTLLLAGLDYASSDPAVIKRLRDSDEVLAVLPSGRMTVADLTREIRFVAFHGLEGKADAGDRRDKIFWDAFQERLLAAEAKRIGLDKRPDMAAYAAQVERSLMLEETLAVLVKFDFAPTDAEVEAFYEAHLADVTPAARIRMESVKLTNEAAAVNLRAKALQGAKLSWLAKNMPDVIDGPPPFPEDLFLPEQLGLKPADVKMGLVPEPYGVPGGWVVARIVELEKTAPLPLAACRDQILKMMQAQALQAHMGTILERLEAASAVTILPGAADEVARVTARVVAARDQQLDGQEAAKEAP